MAHFALPFILLGCAGAGPYGFARRYVPSVEEKPHLRNATQATYAEVAADPVSFSGVTVGWFGFVEDVKLDEATGEATARLSYRRLQARNLCHASEARTCRVTVSNTDLGTFHAILQLRSEDQRGRDRLWAGSLLRVYGPPLAELAADGAPTLRAKWYRHWPRGTFVTTAAASYMRR